MTSLEKITLAAKLVHSLAPDVLEINRHLVRMPNTSFTKIFGADPNISYEWWGGDNDDLYLTKTARRQNITFTSVFKKGDENYVNRPEPTEDELDKLVKELMG